MRRQATKHRPPAEEAGRAANPAWSVAGRRSEWVVAVAASLWIVFLHGLFLFHAGPLWRDEVGTIDFAAMPTVGDIWHNLQYDNFPPLFVALARAWTWLGFHSDFGYRVFGFVVGLGTLGAIWFGARVFGAGVPLLALALYAANPVAIRVGDSMRPYGLGILLTLLALGLIWKSVESPGRRSWWWATMAAVLSVQCLYQNAIFLFAFLLATWTTTRKPWKTAAPTLVIGIAAALSLLPHWANIWKGRDWLEIARRPVHLSDLGSALIQAVGAPGAVAAWCWAGVVLAAVIVGVHGAMRRGSGKMRYGLAAMLGGALLYGLFLTRLGLQPRPWYFLILLAPAALAADAILADVSSPVLRAGRAVVAALLVSASGWACERQVQWRQTNIDLVAATLKEQAQPQDLILVSPWYYGVSLQRYFGAGGFTTLPPMEEIRIHRYDLMKQQMMAENPIGPVLESVRRTLQSGHALWVVGLFQFPPAGAPQPVYPPYHGGLDMADATYFSSWMFQISQIVQTHASNGGEVRISPPPGATINSLEDVPVFVFRGWRD